MADEIAFPTGDLMRGKKGLVMGVANGPTPRAVSSCHRVGGDLRAWAKDVVLNMAPSFSIPPKFEEVQHPDGLVLVIAVPRAPILIPT